VVAFAGILALLLSEREFRRRVLRALALAAILVAALFLVRPLPLTPSNAPGSQAPVHGVPASSGAGDDVVVPQAPNPKTSNALTLLVAVGAAALLTGLGLATWLWAKPRLWAHADPAVLDELALEAGRAADAIRAGDDPRDAVLRCYKEMCRVLARHGAVRESSSLTPREFASLLRARGMVNQHADRLTWIFEEVRYGSRPSAPLAGQAVACLEAIQAAYAGGTA